MTTAPTDTGKRLSDVELAAIIARHNLSAPYHGHTPAEISYNTGREERRALLSHIAALTAERGNISEDQAREIFAEGRAAISAIQQAVSECSGGGACCEAMREAAAKVCDTAHDEHSSAAQHWRDAPEGSQRMERYDRCLARAGVAFQCAKAIRALPIPPSPVKRDLAAAQADLAAALRTAGSLPDSTYVHDSDVRISIGTLRALAEAPVKESRDAVIEECAKHLEKEACAICNHDDCIGFRESANILLALKFKQPDAGAEK